MKKKLTILATAMLLVGLTSCKNAPIVTPESSASEITTSTITSTEPSVESSVEHEHSWGTATVTKEATHTEEGEKTRTCLICGETKTETIERIKNHAFGEWTTTKQSTHMEEGEEKRTCPCGESETRAIDKLADHLWTSWEITIAPTCESAGEQTRTCPCGKTEKEPLSAKGHSFGSWTTTAEPDCETTGSKTRTCSNCGKVENTTVPATGHNYSSWTTTKEPTCTETGSRVRTCSNCGKEEKDTIKETGHSFANEWRYDSESHYHVCANGCGEKSNVTPHTLTVMRNAEQHWSVCPCGYSTPKEDHAFTREEPTAETLKSSATYSDPAYYYRSCSCGEISTTSTYSVGTPIYPVSATEFMKPVLNDYGVVNVNYEDGSACSIVIPMLSDGTAWEIKEKVGSCENQKVTYKSKDMTESDIEAFVTSIDKDINTEAGRRYKHFFERFGSINLEYTVTVKGSHSYAIAEAENICREPSKSHSTYYKCRNCDMISHSATEYIEVTEYEQMMLMLQITSANYVLGQTSTECEGRINEGTLRNGEVIEITLANGKSRFATVSNLRKTVDGVETECDYLKVLDGIVKFTVNVAINATSSNMLVATHATTHSYDSNDICETCGLSRNKSVNTYAVEGVADIELKGYVKTQVNRFSNGKTVIMDCYLFNFRDSNDGDTTVDVQHSFTATMVLDGYYNLPKGAYLEFTQSGETPIKGWTSINDVYLLDSTYHPTESMTFETDYVGAYIKDKISGKTLSASDLTTEINVGDITFDCPAKQMSHWGKIISYIEKDSSGVSWLTISVGKGELSIGSNYRIYSGKGSRQMLVGGSVTGIYDIESGSSVSATAGSTVKIAFNLTVDIEMENPEATYLVPGNYLALA